MALGNILERKAVTTMTEFLQETLVTLMSLGAGFGMLALIPADMFGGVLLDSTGVAGGAALIGYEFVLGRRRRAEPLGTG